MTGFKCSESVKRILIRIGWGGRLITLITARVRFAVDQTDQSKSRIHTGADNSISECVLVCYAPFSNP